ncbi:MAG TPA: hypothetical protein VGE20_21275 [Ramlibacter sp.]
MRVYAANIDRTFSLDDVIATVLMGYASGKTPALVVKAGLQLGIDPQVLMLLPGVTPEAYAQGKWLIDSGAFVATAAGTEADGAYTGPIDMASAQVHARLAAGLDPYGFPPEQVQMMREAGTYIEPYAAPVQLVGVV